MLKAKIYCCFVFIYLILFSSNVGSQNTTVSGIVNKYLPIDSVVNPDIAYYPSDAQINDFAPGDKVLLIQMTGTLLNTPGKYRGSLDYGSVLNENNCGNYEFLEINRIDKINNRIFFTKNFKQTYSNHEKFQLVKVFISDKLIINDTIKAKSWDGKTGGIVALFVFDTLFLNGIVDVSAKGFRGSLPFDNYSGGCRPDNDTLNFKYDEINRGGRKGEGCVSMSFSYIYGPFFNANGGGGGKGKYGGGGGGSGYNRGGSGGYQEESCGDVLQKAMGGMSNTDFYSISNRLKFGGGGGAGVENKNINKIGTKGGNGGGVVIIIAGTIISNNGKILAEGESVNEVASASAGGGGGGGVIFIDTDVLSGNCYFSVKGGNGGNTYSSRTGAGGGGSGGIIWLSKSFNINYNIEGGNGGISYGLNSGEKGLNGVLKLNSLELPLNGMLFNAIFENDTVCEGIQPPLIKATRPRGGTGIYSYKWEKSIDKITWSDAQGIGNLMEFQPLPLSQTTYFRRIVNSGDVSDTSRPIEIFVYPMIKNNTIAGTDTICYDDKAKPIKGADVIGGNGLYTFLWQKSSDSMNFLNAVSQSSQNIPYEPGNLQQTIYVRRLVTSTKYCSNYSNVVKITVLPKITNNLITSVDTVLCYNLPAHIKASIPLGGDGFYTYLWQKSDNNNWINIDNSNVQNLFTDNLTNDINFRRIVFSGSDNACKDTTKAYKITVLPSITNNIINIDSVKYCYGDEPKLLKGTQPQGGDGIYNYHWIKTINQNNYVILANNKDFQDTSKLYSNLSYRRVVYSGQFNACIDTSNEVKITVVPYIYNKLNLDNQSICEGSVPGIFNCQPATGGIGLFDYTWFKKTQGSEWSIADGVSNQSNYQSPVLYEPTYFVRKVTSDICTSMSDTVFVDVISKIKDNIIFNTDGKVYKCYNTKTDIDASMPGGGRNNDFLYEWILSKDNNTWERDIENSNKNYTGAFKELTYLRRIVYSTSSKKECVDTSNIVEVFLNPLPEGDIFSKIDTICAGDSLFIRFYVKSGNPPYVLSVGNNNYIFTKTLSEQANNDSIKIVLNTPEIIKMLSIKDDSGCIADISNFKNEAKIQVYKIPSPLIEGENEICGNRIILQAKRSIDTSRIKWSGYGIQFSKDTEPITDAIAESYGKHKIYLNETNWKCLSRDSIDITFYKFPQIVDAGTDQVLDFKFRTKLNAKTPDAGHGTWKIVEGSGFLTDSLDPSTYIYGLDFKNILLWTVKNGVCPSITDTLVILVNPLKISKVLTPNNDNFNDQFSLKIDNLEKAQLIIFNSKGEIVYENDNFGNDNNWDGVNMKNYKLPTGTYYYILKIKVKDKSDTFIYKGYMELINK